MVTKKLRRFVENGISNLRTFLNRDPARAKAELQSHLREIRITPNRESKEEWHYVAEGSWNLVGSGPNAPVMELAHSGWLRGLDLNQRTNSISMGGGNRHGEEQAKMVPGAGVEPARWKSTNGF
jgi:hypothetical protein